MLYYIDPYIRGSKEGVFHMESRIKDRNADFLMAAILKLESIDECYRFFEDLCTVQEVRAMAQRLAVAHMLKDGWVYNDIVSKTGASTATISRVSRSLNYYGADGYKIVFERLTDEDRALLPKRDSAAPEKPAPDGGQEGDK